MATDTAVLRIQDFLKENANSERTTISKNEMCDFLLDLLLDLNEN